MGNKILFGADDVGKKMWEKEKEKGRIRKTKAHKICKLKERMRIEMFFRWNYFRVFSSRDMEGLFVKVCSSDDDDGVSLLHV